MRIARKPAKIAKIRNPQKFSATRLISDCLSECKPGMQDKLAFSESYQQLANSEGTQFHKMRTLFITAGGGGGGGTKRYTEKLYISPRVAIIIVLLQTSISLYFFPVKVFLIGFLIGSTSSKNFIVAANI